MVVVFLIILTVGAHVVRGGQRPQTPGRSALLGMSAASAILRPRFDARHVSAGNRAWAIPPAPQLYSAEWRFRHDYVCRLRKDARDAWPSHLAPVRGMRQPVLPGLFRAAGQRSAPADRTIFSSAGLQPVRHRDSDASRRRRRDQRSRLVGALEDVGRAGLTKRDVTHRGLLRGNFRGASSRRPGSSKLGRAWVTGSRRRNLSDRLVVLDKIGQVTKRFGRAGGPSWNC